MNVKKTTLTLMAATLPALLLMPAPAGATQTPCEDAITAFQDVAEGSNGHMTDAVADALANAAKACQHEPPRLEAQSVDLPGLPDNSKHRPTLDVSPPLGCKTGVAYTAFNARIHLRVVVATQVWDFQTWEGEGEYTHKTGSVTWRNKFFGNSMGLYGLVAHDMGFGGTILIGGAAIPADSADALGNCGGRDVPCEGQGIALWDHGFAMFADGYLNVCSV